MREDLHRVEGPSQPPTNRSAAAGDVDVEFVERLAESLDDLYRLACRLELDPDRALDLVQDGMLAAYRRRRQLESFDSFRGWAAQILRRTFLNSRRRRREEPWPGTSAEASEPAFTVRPLDPEERFLARARAAEMRAALDALPLGQREAVLLIDVLGFSFSEAATALDSPPGTVASRVVRGRAALRLRLRHLVQEGRVR